MSTSAQIAANRANAQKSCGPKSAESKAVSSLNATKHGLADNTTFFLNPDESMEAFEKLHLSLVAEYAAESPSEIILARRMAEHDWLRARALRFQSLCFDHVVLTAPKTFAIYLRYQQTHERGFSKCMKELLTLREAKEKGQIGFVQQKAEAALQRAVALVLKAGSNGEFPPQKQPATVSKNKKSGNASVVEPTNAPPQAAQAA